MPQVALSTEFLQAFAVLPRQQQKKVRAFVEKFKADPTQASINYEPIFDMADSKVRTVRIGDDYRAIVIHPPQGDVYLCVWVDHHDEAMAWARRKHFEVNPHTGSLQVWESVQTNAPQDPQRVEKQKRAVVEGLFQKHADETLLAFGVPEPLLPAVRAVVAEPDLDRLARFLPHEANDALYLLAAGYGIEDALEELARQADRRPTVDPEDFSAALARPESRRQFKLVDSDQELSDILNAPLAQWRIFLHPSQRKLVELDSGGPVRVLGGAGTGKTVVAMHRARHLASRPGFLAEGEKILVTTFTRNLAIDIRKQLDLLCGAERSRIEVKNLHKVARDVLSASGVSAGNANQGEDERWKGVLDSHRPLAFPDAFYREEWTHVVQDQSIADEAAYLRARRVGRGTPISRGQRRSVWKVMEAYRCALDQEHVMEAADLVREARLWLDAHPAAPRYRAVIADEVQDFRQPDLELLRALAFAAPNDVFVTGDAHQRIYGHQSSLLRAGINIRGRRSRRLRINYRTTQQIRGWAVGLLAGLSVDDLDEGMDDAKGERSLRLGRVPDVRIFPDDQAERHHICETIDAWLKEGLSPADICIAARTKRLVSHYAQALADAGIATEVIDPEGESSDSTKVRLGTMHRVKGLEFRRVILAGVQDGEMPQEWRLKQLSDESAKAMFLQGERQLLYVAATRARDELVVTGSGRRSALLALAPHR